MTVRHWEDLSSIYRISVPGEVKMLVSQEGEYPRVHQRAPRRIGQRRRQVDHLELQGGTYPRVINLGSAPVHLPQ